MEDLYQELKLHTTKELDLIAKKLGITAHIFKDGFLVHYINGLIVSSEVLNARNSFDTHKWMGYLQGGLQMGFVRSKNKPMKLLQI